MPRNPTLSTTLTWRPASTPPKTEGNYLVAMEDGTVHEAVFRARSLTHGGITVDWTEWVDPYEEMERYHPTHWAAMPNAPKKTEKKETNHETGNGGLTTEPKMED